MWEQYEPPGGGTESQPKVPSPSDPGLSRHGSGRRPTVAGGTHTHGPGVVLGLVAVMTAIGIGVTVAGSADPEPDYSGFYACVAEKEAEGEGGLLSPADLCEIGNERPPDYVDDHEFDPYGDVDNGYDDGYGY